MARNWTDKRIVIQEGWYDAGQQGIALGEPVFVLQDWVPVKMDDEEDPTFHKKAGLAFVPDGPVDPYADIRAVRSGKRAEGGDPRNTIDRLLLDADALLTTVPVLYSINMQATRMERATKEQRYLVADLERIIKLSDDAIAALPEHLK